MNIFSNNICGIGCEVKRSWVKDSKIENHSFLVGQQETKSLEVKDLEVKDGLDRQILGSPNFQCYVV